ncbi:pirin family protein [Rhizobium sp.]|jgi:quercetin 2,3-dioxygenase|uniref:pirin family protein n=1 Tax=Rhizobium sp. TaxID=391 RepID=UPI000E80D57E|nr:quercetin 2,3-dioxygenase [Rhizobium sp.]
MILIHEAMNRGHTDMGWLKSEHSFSFGGFLDPTRMGYANLRVINEDRIVPGSGFGEHAHQDMDILTLVLSGKLKHEDTLGNVATIAPGEVQLMSAGSGIDHSEMNASDSDGAHFLQIWLIPDTQGGVPTYQQTALPSQAEAPDWTVIASGNTNDGALRLLSDTRLSIAYPREGMPTSIPKQAGRLYFLHIVKGLAMVDGERLGAGDGVQIGAEDMPDLHWVTDGQALLFDMHR